MKDESKERAITTLKADIQAMGDSAARTTASKEVEAAQQIPRVISRDARATSTANGCRTERREAFLPLIVAHFQPAQPIGGHMHRYLKVLAALTVGLLASLPGNLQPLRAGEPNPVTALISAWLRASPLASL